MSHDIVRGFLSIFSAQFGSLLLGFLITPLLVRVLGSQLYGDYVFVLSILGVLIIVSNAGINDGVRKFIAEDRSTPNWSGHVFGFYLRVAIVLSVAAAGVLLVAVGSGLVPALLGNRFGTYVLLIAPLLVGRQLFLTVRSALMGLGLEHYSEPLVVGEKAVFGIVGLALASLGWGVIGVLGGHLVAVVLACSVGFAITSRRVRFGVIRSSRPADFPRWTLLSFNGANVLLVLLTTSLYHVDILLLQPLAGSVQTGYYRAALLVAEFIWFVPLALQLSLLHSTSELWSKDRTEEIASLASRTTRYTVMASSLLGLGIAALADAFVPLYFGPAFGPAAPLVLFLVPGAFGFAVSRPILAIGQSRGDLRPLVLSTGVAAVLNLGLNVVLIPPYGMYGAAIATAVGYGSMLALHVISARRIGFEPFSDVRLPRQAATALLTGAVVFGIANAITADVVALLVVPPVGLIVYTSTALRLGLLDGEEVERAVTRLPHVLRAPVLSFVRVVE